MRCINATTATGPEPGAKLLRLEKFQLPMPRVSSTSQTVLMLKILENKIAFRNLSFNLDHF